MLSKDGRIHIIFKCTWNIHKGDLKRGYAESCGNLLIYFNCGDLASTFHMFIYYLYLKVVYFINVSYNFSVAFFPFVNQSLNF